MPTMMCDGWAVISQPFVKRIHDDDMMNTQQKKAVQTEVETQDSDTCSFG